jgi:hypothetical protein
MKYFIYLLAVTISIDFSMAQNDVNLRFSAKMQDNGFQALDSVNVINLTRGWEETIYYPDTVLQMVNSVGIVEMENTGYRLFQNTPNPFFGTTDVSLQLIRDDNIVLALYDLNGRKYAVYAGMLTEGMHRFTIEVEAVQMYVLEIKSSQGIQRIKLLAKEKGKDFIIAYQNTVPLYSQQQIQKAKTDKVFISGDNMKFIAYTTYEGEKRQKQLTTTQQGNDEVYVFQFPIGYSVGDVYYDAKGEEEGIVCWIADTLFYENEKPYGIYGKMISVDQSGKGSDEYLGLMYATIRYPTYAFDSVDGRVNTAIHMALRSDTSQYIFKERIEAAKWCTDKGDGWYFPAKLEMLNVFENVDLFNSVLTEIGGTLFFTDFMGPECSYYWTSTEVPGAHGDYNYYYAYSIYFLYGEIKYQYYEFYNQLNVRAMKWFNEP